MIFVNFSTLYLAILIPSLILALLIFSSIFIYKGLFSNNVRISFKSFTLLDKSSTSRFLLVIYSISLSFKFVNSFLLLESSSISLSSVFKRISIFKIIEFEFLIASYSFSFFLISFLIS